MFVFISTDLLNMRIEVAPPGTMKASLEIELLQEFSRQRTEMKRLADETEEEILLPQTYVSKNTDFAVITNLDQDLYLYVIEELEALPASLAEWTKYVEGRLQALLNNISARFRSKHEIESLWCPRNITIV